MTLALRTMDSSIYPEEQRYGRLLSVANRLLILSVLVMLVGIAVSFIFPHYFSTSVQVMAHIATIVFAGILKVVYVLRCVGRKGPGQEVSC